MNTPGKITPEEFRKMTHSGKLKYSHTSYRLGYVSRKIQSPDVIPTPYCGKFGRGYTLSLPAFDTSRYYNLTYYIFE